jgi:hypothetical protein
MSNGVISRPSFIKKENATAELLNIVIKLDQGFIKSIEWKNDCIS